MEMALEVIWPTPARGSSRCLEARQRPRSQPTAWLPLGTSVELEHGARVGRSGHTAQRALTSKQSLVLGEGWAQGGLACWYLNVTPVTVPSAPGGPGAPH